MQVLIDGRYIGRPGGFGRYIDELCRALGSIDTHVKFIVAVPKCHDEAPYPQYNNVSWYMLPNINLILWQQLLIPWLAHRLNCDLIHFTHNTSSIFTGGIKTVTTIHDLMFLHVPHPFRDFRVWIASVYSKWSFYLGSRRSDALISVSDATKRALAEHGLKAHTVYLTVDGFVKSLPPNYITSKKSCILHRGGYLPNRNTERVINAFRSVRKNLPNHTALKIVGVPEGATRWKVDVDENIIFLPRLTDRELAELYIQSSVVLATSLQEGFGLPIIEAFAFGTPVITSNVDPMREIASDAALLVDPNDGNQIAEAIRTIFINPDLAQALVEKGYHRNSIFSSSRMSSEMLRIYLSV